MGVLDRFKLAGVVATWWTETLALKLPEWDNGRPTMRAQATRRSTRVGGKGRCHAGASVPDAASLGQPPA